MSSLSRLVRNVGQLRSDGAATAPLMFGYIFLVMTAYNMVAPVARSTFIAQLGAGRLPYALLPAGLVTWIALIGCGRLTRRLPPGWALPAAPGLIAISLATLWMLVDRGVPWVSVALYLWAAVLGVLLIGQFWTLANAMYDAPQAKQHFGLFGGGALLGGLTGSLVAASAEWIGTARLLLIAAAVLLASAWAVARVIGRRPRPQAARPLDERARLPIPERRAFALFKASRHLQSIAVLVALAGIGGAVVDQQLNMAAQAIVGRTNPDGITALLGVVGAWTFGLGLVIHVWLTNRIHRLLGIGFAVMVLPLGLGLTASVVLLNAALWAPGLARVLEQALRQTVDKTTREILLLPLSTDAKPQVTAAIEVAVDGAAKTVAAGLLVVLVEPWALGLDWPRVSWATLCIAIVWAGLAMRARKGYLSAFRRSLDRREVEATEVRLRVGDLSTIEALVEELARLDEERVVYAIDLLESLDKRHLVTPLLLHHESAQIRSRAVRALAAVRSDIAEQWLPAIRRLVDDPSPEVRVAAMGTLAHLQAADAVELARPLIADSSPKIQATAAIVLAGSAVSDDVAKAEATFTRLAADRHATAHVRRDVAVAVRLVGDARCRHLLIPMLRDPDPDVAEEAMRSVVELGTTDPLFVPTLVSLLANRRLKSGARAALVGFGEPVLDALGHFLRDRLEDPWVRRHLPATIARIPGQRAADVLLACLQAGEPDRFVRYKIVVALERLHRQDANLRIDAGPVEAILLDEARAHLRHLALHHDLFVRAANAEGSLLEAALDDKLTRGVDRIYRLLGLLYPWKDVGAARWAIQHGEAGARANAFEYLGNTLSGPLRRFLLPILEDLPLDQKVQRANVLLKSRPRSVAEALLRLIHDDDPVISACAIQFVANAQCWALADDLEHLLAYRDVADWFVFEAASWALAIHRAPAGQRPARWAGPLPSVEIVTRLRRTPLFAAVSVDELFRMVSAGRQEQHEPGQPLLRQGVVPDTARVLLEGAVDATDDVREPTRHGDGGPGLAWTWLPGQPGTRIEAPAALAFVEALQGHPAPSTLRAIDQTVTLALDANALYTALADSTALLEGVFRTLIGRMPEERRRLVLRGGANEQIARTPIAELTAVHKVLALGQVPTFARLPANEMLHLASITKAVALRREALLTAEADPPALCLVVSGELSLDPPPNSVDQHPPVRARPGDAVGVHETLTGIAIGRRTRVVREGTALHITHDDLYDLLAHRPALLQQLFGRLIDEAEAARHAG